MPSVSVVMPVFNGDKYLRSAIDSVLGQSLADLELIVVDDGSTDGTPQILDSYDDPRLRVVRQENCGIAVALNVGIEAATTGYVARMDADDISLPDRLRRQHDYLRSSPQIAAVGCSYSRVDEQGRQLSVTATLCSPSSLRRMLFVHNPLGHGSTMVRTAVLREHGGYRADKVPAEDYDLWIRIAAQHDVSALPEVLYEYRVHGAGSVGSRQHEMSLDIRDCLWARDRPTVPTIAEVKDELAGYRQLQAPLSKALVAEFHAGHYSLLREAVRRRRWGTVARFARTAPYFVARQRVRRAST